MIAGMTDASQIQDRIAANVRAELGRRKFTTIEAATRLNMHPNSMRSRLNGEVEFSGSEIVTLATWLGVSPAALIDVDSPAPQLRPRGSDPGVIGGEVLPDTIV